LQIIALYDRWEKTFWDYVDEDLLNYYFFIFDWKLHRDQTKILMAMEDERIEGLMLIYRDYIVQLRGNRDAVKMLLGLLSLEKVELQAPLDYEDLVLAKYGSLKVREEMILMSLTKGNENIQTTTSPIRLNSNDAENVLELMRKADPSWWGEMQLDNLRRAMQEAFWLGIKQDGMVVSVGMTRLVSFASNIGVAATREEYRNRGYATSIVSELVKEILRISATAIIHVISDNAPAIRAYSKVGFKPYRTYLSVRT
jgi:ribosomal protein S18 acetylase RimI-like enzyme